MQISYRVKLFGGTIPPKRSLAEQFRQINHSVAESLVEISFWFGKVDPNEEIR